MNNAKAKKAVDHLKIVLQEAVTALTEAELKATTFRSEYEEIEKSFNQHNLINMQRQVYLQLDAELLTANKLVERWEQTLQLLADLKANISEKEVQKGVLIEKLRVAVSSHTAAEAEELTAKNYFQTLTSATDSIRQAVASIAAHLPDDRGDCPLCGEEHGAAALHERVTKALKAIDPNVVDAERYAKKASDALRESHESVTIVETELKACRSEIVDLKLQKTDLTTQAEEFRTNTLISGKTVPLARESIRRSVDANDTNIRLLNEEQQNLQPPIAPKVFDQTKSSYDSAVLLLNHAQQNHSEANSKLEQAAAALAAITADTQFSQTIEELSIEKNHNANHILDLSTKTTAEHSALDRQKTQLSELTNNVSSLKTQLSETQSRLATLRANWRQLSFTGDPTAEAASSHQAHLQSILTELTRHSKTIETIKIEIGAWRKLEQVRVVQGLLDNRRGELSEAQFFENLSQRVRKKQSGVEKLSLLLMAMESLNQFLASEIANVHEHVLAVVPRWQALLKQVVRDQRFSDTDLDFRSAYGKERAEASVLLHGASTPVTSIASEAQLTDLQLTFLLSMALDHQWSSWRGLLLDDPTQHHDMVHAASVFDVLRDYIVNHDFQIVIATHDALQARYFLRKLQNDGIEARIWSLVPTPNGVVAEESKRQNRTSI